MKRLAAILILVAGCTQSTPWPLSVQGSLATLCGQQYGKTANCDCFVQELQKRIPYTEYVAIDEAMKTGAPMPVEFAKKAAEAAAACAGK